MNDIITITVADLAALDSWERDKACDVIAQIWGKRAEQYRPPEPTTFTLIEPGAIPEPVEAPRENFTAPAGAPGKRQNATNNMREDLPKPAADYSADISESGQASVQADGSDSSPSPDGAKSKPHPCPECGHTFTRRQALGGHRAHVHGVKGAGKKPGLRTGDSNITLDSRPPQPLPGERWQHTCDRCQRTFPGERTLEAHERTCGRAS